MKQEAQGPQRSPENTCPMACQDKIKQCLFKIDIYENRLTKALESF